VEKFGMSKSEEKNFIKSFNPPFDEEPTLTNGNGRHHHYSLAKTMSEILQRLDELEISNEVFKMVLGEDYCKIKKVVKKIRRQEDKVLQEQRKLLKMIQATKR